jgi:hypothetical protein
MKKADKSKYKIDWTAPTLPPRHRTGARRRTQSAGLIDSIAMTVDARIKSGHDD